MKLLNSILAISGLVQGRYYHGNGKCGTLESCSGNLILSRVSTSVILISNLLVPVCYSRGTVEFKEDGCCNAKTLCKMYSDENDFKEVFPDLDCDNLPEDDSADKPDKKPGKPDKKPESPDKKPDNDNNDDSNDQVMEPESHLNFEPHNSNIQNFINYNTDFETKINFNMGKNRIISEVRAMYILGGVQEKNDHKVDRPAVSEPCPEITMQGNFPFLS